MKLRKLAGGLAAIAGAALCVSSAVAADLPPSSAPAPVAPVAYAPAAIYSWTGFYLGGELGGAFARSSWDDPFSGGHNRFNSAGFLGGGQVGANYQINRLVLGVEGDFDWTGGMGLKGSGTDSIGDGIGTGVNWTSTVTGRIGMAFNRLLVYGKGGVAFADDQSTFTDLFGNGATSSFTRTGWTAGLGLEYALNQNWSARIEYDYLGFGPEGLNFTTATPIGYSTNASLGIQEIKAGLNFRFGGP